MFHVEYLLVFHTIFSIMSSVFRKTNDYVEQVKRNTFDLSFTNNLTMKFGTLYPVLCKEVLPGDSFRIDSTFALKFMPMVFPVQTRMQANLHFFYVRNRSLWQDWTDFIGRTKTGLVSPYLTLTGDQIKTGSLADYLGIPTVTYDTIPISNTIKPGDNSYIDLETVFASQEYQAYQNDYVVGEPFDVTKIPLYSTDDNPEHGTRGFGILPNLEYTYGIKDLSLRFQFASSSQNKDTLCLLVIVRSEPSSTGSSRNTIAYVQKGFPILSSSGSGNYSSYEFHDVFLPSLGESGSYYLYMEFYDFGGEINDTGVYVPGSSGIYDNASFKANVQSLEIKCNTVGAVGLASNNNYNPFSQDYILPVSALPFRAYEFIYNSFYRNQLNDPFKINGKVEYNRYLTNLDGGKDSFVYQLHQRNWEDDFLTTCVQQPQQGIAPLVGVVDQTVTFRDDDGKDYTATAEVENGKIKAFNVHTSDMPEGNIRQLVDIATSGISINDFRNVNSLQRWLEANQRRGYKYQDQIMTHYGVEVKFDDYDYPEFIGGLSRPIIVNQVNQTADTPDMPLGSFAGQASCLGDAGHSINKYCDEHGFIMAILSISPVPVYSQLLPKHFLKSEALDYYFPEFAHIGMQPVTYSEVAPISSHIKDVGESFDQGWTTQEFGYQRAWYDYLSSVDESHGAFRTNLRNFLLNREFSGIPKLNGQFLHINPEEIDNIWSIQTDTDKIIGQIYFNITAQRPIAAFGVPKLE